jgi:hypothetical protein
LLVQFRLISLIYLKSPRMSIAIRKCTPPADKGLMKALRCNIYEILGAMVVKFPEFEVVAWLPVSFPAPRRAVDRVRAVAR